VWDKFVDSLSNSFNMSEDITPEASLEDLEAQLAELRARTARERERAAALLDGTFFSTIDEVWNKVDADIQNPHLFGLDSENRVSLIRTHHVVVADTNRYEQTVIAASQTADAANEQTAIAATGNRNNSTSNEVSSVADSSTRSSSSSLGVNIFGGDGSGAQSAHLLPHASFCSKYWIPVVPWVLCTGNIQLSWDFLQKCIHGTLTEPNDGDNGSNASGRRQKHSHVGIKHFRTNRIQLNGQETIFDKYPCVIIVPLLNLTQVKEWDGGAYSAIVLAGNYTNRRTQRTVSATAAYVGIQAFANMLNYDDLTDVLANEDECNEACLLLKQFIFCVIEAFRADVNANLMSENANKLQKFVEWNTILNEPSVPVPVSNVWDVNRMKVRKVSFGVSTEANNPAPDPVLLLAKAASNWLRRHELAILPGCGDDDSTSSSEDSTDSAISYSKEESMQEIDINVNRDEVEEPLSDDEFFR
jgi:hypothetical protein